MQDLFLFPTHKEFVFFKKNQSLGWNKTIVMGDESCVRVSRDACLLLSQKTDISLQNRPTPTKKGLSPFYHHFSGTLAVSFRECGILGGTIGLYQNLFQSDSHRVTAFFRPSSFKVEVEKQD